MIKISRCLFVSAALLAISAGCDSTGGSGTARQNPTTPNGAPRAAQNESPSAPVVQGQYASVNGLKMYYEIHGAGRPLVMLHGAFGWATVSPALAKVRQVIAIELQGHGHTADIDRPLSFEQMADDTAALLEHLKIEQADLFGYSMGGNVALAVAIRHPKLVRKVVVNGSNSGKIEEAYEPAGFQQFQNMPADFAPPMLKGAYDKVAPDPSQWPALVAKIKKMGLEFQGFSRDQMQSIQAPVLIAVGDRDIVRPEHAVEMFRQIPNAQLAVFPGGDHFLIFQSPDKLMPVVVAFLDAQGPPPQMR